MLDARAAALATSDVTFFSLPPLRPPRSARRRDGDNGVARNLIRAIRRELERAAEADGVTVIPRVTNYPY